MIRNAVPADMTRLAAMARKFHAASGMDAFVPFDIASVEKTMAHLIASPDGALVISPAGMAGAVSFPVWFNHGYRMAQEMFWWAEDGEGAALRDRIERRARDRGASVMSMLALDSMRPDAMARAYRIAGYEPMERSFMKAL